MFPRAVCTVLGHRFLRIRYPGSPDGYFLRCTRCGREREEKGGDPSLGGGMLGG
jgi:hypothetical protein